MAKRHENANLLIIIMISALLAAGFTAAAFLPYNETGEIFGVNYSLAAYVVLLLAAFVLFLLLRALSGLLPKSRGPLHTLPGLLLDAIYAISALSLVLYIFYIYKNENNIFPQGTSATYIRQLVPHRWYFLVVIIISLILFITATRTEMIRHLNCRVAVGAVFSLLTAFAAYSACPLFDGGGGSYHSHAVTNTIVNVARGIPFSDLNISIYGHYALIFYPFVKLLGGGYEAIAISLSFFTFVTYAAAFYAASRLVRRDDIFIYTTAAAAATSTTLTRRGQYFQVIPLRLIMPCLALACLAFAFSERGKRHKKAVMITSFALGILALIWNFETGLFAVLTIAATFVFAGRREHRFFSLRTLRDIILGAVYLLLSFGAAFVLVGVYNKGCGGDFGTPRQFIYPLLSETYTVQHLRTPLPSVPCLYVFEIMLFFAAIMAAILRRPSASSAQTSEGSDAAAVRSSGWSGDPAGTDTGTHSAPSEGSGRPAPDIGTLALTFATGLSGLLSLIYFINRAAFGNLAISTIQMAILLGVFSEDVFSFSRKDLKTMFHFPAKFGRAALSGAIFIVLIFASIEGTLYSGICLLNRVQAGSWIRTGFEQADAWVTNVIPEDTIACGIMLPEIYFDCGRDPHIALTDWSDMNELNLSYAKNEILSHDHVLIEESSGLQSFLDENGYELSSSLSCGDKTFHYYVKK